MATKSIFLILALLFSFNISARDLKSGTGDGINFKTNGNNTRGSISSAGVWNFPLLDVGSIPYLDGSGDLVTNTGFTFNGTLFVFPLADGTINIGNGSGVGTPTMLSGDVTVSNAGVTAIGSGVIGDADVNASAAISATKIHDGSVDNTEYGYLNGVTSAIQTQINAITSFDFTASNDNRIVKTDTVGGNQIQETGITVTDTNQISGVDQLNIATEGELRFEDAAGGEYNGFKSPITLSGSTTFTLPDGDGTSGQVLQTNGSAVLSWATPASSPSFTVVTKSTSATLATTAEDHVLCDASGGDVTLTLPTASGNNGLTYKIVKIDSSNNKCVVDGNAAETVGGEATLEIYGQNKTLIVTADGTDFEVLEDGREITFFIRDEKASGTAGGTATSGSWQTRDLQTITGETGHAGVVSVASNAFTLAKGTYEIHGTCPGYRVDDFKCKLRNTSDSVDVLFGTTENVNNSDASTSESKISGVFTITASKTFELQQYVITTVATNGFGTCNASIGDVCIYTQVKLRKIK